MYGVLLRPKLWLGLGPGLGLDGWMAGRLDGDDGPRAGADMGKDEIMIS